MQKKREHMGSSCLHSRRKSSNGRWRQDRSELDSVDEASSRERGRQMRSDGRGAACSTAGRLSDERSAHGTRGHSILTPMNGERTSDSRSNSVEGREMCRSETALRKPCRSGGETRRNALAERLLFVEWRRRGQTHVVVVSVESVSRCLCKTQRHEGQSSGMIGPYDRSSPFFKSHIRPQQRPSSAAYCHRSLLSLHTFGSIE